MHLCRIQEMKNNSRHIINQEAIPNEETLVVLSRNYLMVSHPLVSLDQKSLGIFQKSLGIFWNGLGIFWNGLGIFWNCLGIFWKCLGIFQKSLGIFQESLGIIGYSISFDEGNYGFNHHLIFDNRNKKLKVIKIWHLKQ
jgi:hypothetical protein